MKQNKIQLLVEKIIKHKNLYYQGHPEISDYDYDQLEIELQNLAPNHPLLSTVGAKKPIQNKITHKTPMLSLQKTYSIKDLISWQKERPLVGTYKIDGNSLSLVYENKELSFAKTRGNGIAGEDIFEKSKWIPDCMQTLDDPSHIEVRGELFCTEKKFSKLHEEMARLGLEKPSNPRNIVAGLLGRKKHFELLRHLSFFAFEVIFYSKKNEISTELQKMSWLQQHGFSIPPLTELKTPEDTQNYIQNSEENIQNLDYGADGVVLCINDIEKQKELGHTAHHPKYKMSFKWQGQTATATIKEIQWKASRLGNVTPVAIISPTKLSGATISNITLHNASHVKNHNLKEHDVIEFVRSGEVIPKFLRVLSSFQGEHKTPNECPSCQQPLIFDDVRLICKNQSCPAKTLFQIINWIKNVDIEDLSDKRLQSMIDQSFVKSIEDLYKLDLEKLLQLPLTKEKMANKILSNIQNSKNIPAHKFFAGLGIENAGATTWSVLLQKFTNLEDLLNATVEDLLYVDGFAEKTSRQIVLGLKRKSELIKNLLDLGIKIQFTKPLDDKLLFSNKNFVITGTFSQPRKNLEIIIKELGGKISSSITKNTFALIQADIHSTSKKSLTAAQLNIPIWDEEILNQKIKS